MKRQRLWEWLALGSTILALFTGLTILELRAEEPRRAIVAMEMVLSDNCLVPQIHGEAYYNKPPLFNWLLAIFFQIFGSFDEWVVRLPGLLSLVGTAVLNFVVVRHYLNRDVAILSSLFYLTAADILFYGAVNAGEIDFFFALLVYAQVLSIFIFHKRQRWWLLFGLSYFFAALGFLTKGVPAIAFQVLTLLAIVGYHRHWRKLVSMPHLLGIVLFSSVVGSYFLWYNQQEDALGFLVNLVYEASQKSASGSAILAIILHLFEFPFNLLKLILPWGLLGYYLFRKNVWSLIRSNELVLFSVLFILANSWIYWLSPSNRNPYLYPFFPFLFLILAFFYQKFSAIPVYRLLQVVVVLAILRLGYTFIGMPLQQERLPYRELTATLLAKADGQPIHYTGSWYNIEAQPSFLGLILYEDTLRTPPLIPYQIPYYLTKEQGEILQFEAEPRAGELYLAYKEFLKGKDVEILHEYHEGWTNNEMALVRFR